jgi:transposase
MSQSRLSMRKIREVLRLKESEAGLSIRAIARACHLSPTTVGEYLDRAQQTGLAWPLPEDLSEEELVKQLFPESNVPPQRDLPDWAYVHQELKRRGVTLQQLWKEYWQDHPNGYRYSQYCHYYAKWKRGLEVVLRIPRRGGEEAEVDYAGGTIEIVDPQTGEITRGYVFVECLPASGYFYVEVQPDCSMTHWIGGNVRALEFFGGAPRILVPDNLKTGVKRPEYYEPDINPTFQYFAEHYGLVVLPARIRHPQDKAHVENAVQQVTRRVLAPLRNRKYFSVAEANQAVQALAKEVLKEPMKHLGQSRRELFEEIDRPALRPLPERAYAYTEIQLAKVHIDYHVEYDRHHYSVPHTLKGGRVEIRAGEHVIQLFFKHQLVATHVRSRVRGGFTTLPEHMPSQHRFIHEVLRDPRNGPGWIMERARRIGPQTAAFVQAIFAARAFPEQGIRSGLGVLSLARKYRTERMEQACARLLGEDRLSSRQLKLHLAREKSPIASPVPLPPHANLRGSESFQSKGG